MPKFGIVKKTFFNPKVLIILIITIVVGTSLFDKNNSKNKINMLNTKIFNNPKKEMGGKGVEPLRTFVHTVLSRTRLPIPPPAQLDIS